MTADKAWVGLTNEDIREMLVALVGFRFGTEPETRLDEIREEREAYAGRFLKMAGVGSDDTVLELGSGCGFGTRAVAKMAKKVLACDISEAYLTYARQELEGIDNIEFHHVQSRDLNAIADHSVDKIVSISVFIHFNLYDIYLYFLEFKRVLKNGGRVVFDFADSHRLGGGIRSKVLTGQFLEHAPYYRDMPSNLPGLVQWNSAKGIRGVAKLAGFRQVSHRGHRLLFESC
ncbi:MAG: class I SAM-dependent methyltransferase [Xanthomonadales bacterium]|nr:class I SAM-dependent methyltransferase [Xanthomonadales bacterium]